MRSMNIQDPPPQFRLLKNSVALLIDMRLILVKNVLLFQGIRWKVKSASVRFH